MSVFEEVINSYFDYYSKNFMTAIPAVVVDSSRISQGIVAVKPLINELTKDGRTSPWPEILEVPVVFPSSSRSAITFPIEKWDSVLLIFSMRGLDEFKGGDGGLVTPSDYRRHDIRDAIAIPCVWPTALSINRQSNRRLPHNTNDLTITHNLGKSQEAEVRIDSSGQIKLTSPLKVQIDSPLTEINSEVIVNDNVTINGDTFVNGDWTYNGEEYALHRHIGVDPGDGTSGPKA